MSRGRRNTSLTETAPKISERELRDFGLIVAGLFAAIFGLLLPLLHRRAIPIWPWAIAAVLLASALARPSILRGFYRVWTRIGLVLGWVNTRIILGVLFYVVLTPMGYIMRALGHGESAPESPDSYRIAAHPIARENFEKPY